MHQRAADLVKELGLSPHPEGGLFREIHKSDLLVEPADGRGRRAALTAIYFLLPAGSVSRWHRVRSDEVWHFYEGSPLTLWVSGPGLERVHRHTLGPLSGTQIPVLPVPGGCWQAARSAGDYTLVGCTVGPGFEFNDFSFASDHPSAATALRSHDPVLAELL
jgi:predicted cupin superfamily sugar epimerase